MMRDIEYISYKDADRIAILENRAAELERRLLAALPADGTPGWGNVATPPRAGAAAGYQPKEVPEPEIPGIRYAFGESAYAGLTRNSGPIGRKHSRRSSTQSF